MSITLQPASYTLLAQIGLDPNPPVGRLPPAQVSHYVAAICWLTEGIEGGELTDRSQINNFLQACHHFCEIEAWQAAWKVLTAPLFSTIHHTLAEQLNALRLGPEQVELYKRLVGKFDPYTNAHCLRALGNGYLNFEGEFHGWQANAHLRAALEAFTALGDQQQMGWILQQMGVNYLHSLSNQPAATEAFTQAISCFRQVNDQQGLAHTLHNLATILSQQGRYTEARPLYLESLTIIYERLDQVDLIQGAWAHLTYADFLIGQGELQQAQQQSRRSLRIFRTLEHRSGLRWVLLKLAALFIHQQRPWLAQLVLHHLTTFYTNLHGMDHDTIAAHHLIGWVALQQHNRRAALHSFQAMIPICIQLNYQLGLANAAEGIAFIAFDTQQLTLSVALLGATDALRQQAYTVATPIQRVRNERVLVDARARLGAAAFTAAWQVGMSWSIDEIVAQAQALTIAD